MRDYGACLVRAVSLFFSSEPKGQGRKQMENNQEIFEKDPEIQVQHGLTTKRIVAYLASLGRSCRQKPSDSLDRIMHVY